MEDKYIAIFSGIFVGIIVSTINYFILKFFWEKLISLPKDKDNISWAIFNICNVLISLGSCKYTLMLLKIDTFDNYYYAIDGLLLIFILSIIIFVYYYLNAKSKYNQTQLQQVPKTYFTQQDYDYLVSKIQSARYAKNGPIPILLFLTIISASGIWIIHSHLYINRETCYIYFGIIVLIFFGILYLYFSADVDIAPLCPKCPKCGIILHPEQVKLAIKSNICPECNQHLESKTEEIA